ncbi:Uncharacterised protein [uncultured archaeon]|nr:Uncharacterised protein [uncultured archaeon]
MNPPIFLWETFKLKLLITFSKTLPKKWKYTLKYHLVNGFLLQDIYLIKGLFYSITLENSYDLYTSSILALHYKNWLSYDVLTRSQIEIFLFTHWIEQNPEKIKDVFNKEIYNCLKDFYKKENDPFILSLWKTYTQYYCKKAHPLPTRFLSTISICNSLKLKNKNFDVGIFMNKKRLREYNALSIEEKDKIIKENFEFESYSPGVSSIPHITREI